MPTLDWLNRASAFTTAARVPYRLLEQVSMHTAVPLTPSLLWGEGGGEGPRPIHDNLLIQGDNLEAIKALLPFYRGQVKCIFIDPPYNTKSAFEHDDDNLEHAQWLSMMLAVVEYKGAHLLNEPYEIEKRQIGELWARKSDSRCLFGQIAKVRDGVGMSGQLDALLA